MGGPPTIILLGVDSQPMIPIVDILIVNGKGKERY